MRAKFWIYCFVPFLFLSCSQQEGFSYERGVENFKAGRYKISKLNFEKVLENAEKADSARIYLILIDSLQGFKKYQGDSISWAKENYEISNPINGYSPYDRYFGEGIYHKTQNEVIVNASSDRDLVFILVDVSSGRKVRNEFIRKGSSFSLTNIPYGVYDYRYYSGLSWSDEFPISKDRTGGFLELGAYSGIVSKEKRLVYEVGSPMLYEITLYPVSNGNLRTKEIDMNEFFN